MTQIKRRPCLQLFSNTDWLSFDSIIWLHSGTPPPPPWVIIFCTSQLDFFIPPCCNRWADTRPSNGWENNCHKVNFIACSVHLWAGGRCPLPGSWWMASPSGAGMKMRGERPEPGSWSPTWNWNFSDTLKIGILIYKRGDVPFSLMMKAAMSHSIAFYDTHFASYILRRLISAHPKWRMSGCPECVENKLLSVSKRCRNTWLSWQQHLLIVHKDVCSVLRLRQDEQKDLMERGEPSWSRICVLVLLCQCGWEPGDGEDHKLPVDISESEQTGAGGICAPALELGPAAESSLLSAGFRPSLCECVCVCIHAHVCLIRSYLQPALCPPYISILPQPLAIASSFAWPSWPGQSGAIIVPLANLPALISIILCLLRALTALTVPLSKEKKTPNPHNSTHFAPQKHASYELTHTIFKHRIICFVITF